LARTSETAAAFAGRPTRAGAGGLLRPNRPLSRCPPRPRVRRRACPASDEVSDRITLQGPGEEVALTEPATQLPKPPELRRRLYPLGDGRQAEGAPDLDDRMNQAVRPPWIVERTHKRPVDLEVGHWELLQVCQRRVSGPKSSMAI